MTTLVYNMVMTVTSFTKKLRILMESRDWSHAQLALRVGVSRTYIGLLLSGDRESPSLDIAARIAKVFGVSLDWLADMPAHEIDQMPTDEQELISSYRIIKDEGLKGYAVESVRGVAAYSAKASPAETDQNKKG